MYHSPSWWGDVNYQGRRGCWVEYWQGTAESVVWQGGDRDAPSSLGEWGLEKIFRVGNIQVENGVAEEGGYKDKDCIKLIQA